MKLSATIIFAFITNGSSFKLNGPQRSRHVRNPLTFNPLDMSDMPYSRRTACPPGPLRHGEPIPGFEDRQWNLPEVYRKRANKKIATFEENQCDTMLVRIEKDQVIDICFHYEFEIGNPWSMETTCVSGKYREIECYMGTSPFAPMPKSCESKEDLPMFLSPSLMNTGLGALLYDFDPTSFDSESSQSFGESYGQESFRPQSFGSESFVPKSVGLESYGPYDLQEPYQSIQSDDSMWQNSFEETPETPEQYYYIDSNGNLRISDCKPSSPNCSIDDDADLRRRKRSVSSKISRPRTHQKRAARHQ